MGRGKGDKEQRKRWSGDAVLKQARFRRSKKNPGEATVQYANVSRRKKERSVKHQELRLGHLEKRWHLMPLKGNAGWGGRLQGVLKRGRTWTRVAVGKKGKGKGMA